MEVIPDKEIGISNNDSYYLPHHCVSKEDSSTTKFVLSLDASAKTSSGVSLNKRLIIGPKLKSDLFHTVLRLRSHAVAFSADMAKMYRQVAMTNQTGITTNCYGVKRLMSRCSTCA